MLKLAPTPDEGYELCDKYARDCSDSVFAENLVAANKSDFLLAEIFETTTERICDDEECEYDYLIEEKEDNVTDGNNI